MGTQRIPPPTVWSRAFTTRFALPKTEKWLASETAWKSGARSVKKDLVKVHLLIKRTARESSLKLYPAGRQAQPAGGALKFKPVLRGPHRHDHIEKRLGVANHARAQFIGQIEENFIRVQAP